MGNPIQVSSCNSNRIVLFLKSITILLCSSLQSKEHADNFILLSGMAGQGMKVSTIKLFLWPSPAKKRTVSFIGIPAVVMIVIAAVSHSLGPSDCKVTGCSTTSPSLPVTTVISLEHNQFQLSTLYCRATCDQLIFFIFTPILQSLSASLLCPRVTFSSMEVVFLF
eukprot:Em1191g1a